MDVESDFVNPSREEFLGATEQGFLEYLREQGVVVLFDQFIYRSVRRRTIDALRDQFWPEYLDGLEFAWKCERDKKTG